MSFLKTSKSLDFIDKFEVWEGPDGSNGWHVSIIWVILGSLRRLVGSIEDQDGLEMAA